MFAKLGEINVYPLTIKHFLVDGSSQTDSATVLIPTRPSVVRSKPAICGHLKTGHSMWPGT